MKSLNIRNLKFQLVALTCASAALTSCDWVRLENGEIPSAYSTLAAEIQQTAILSPQSFSKRPDLRGSEPTLRLKLEGRKIVLQASFDFWGPGCGSKIGNAESVMIESGQLREITFDIDPGKCDPAFIKSHRDLQLKFTENSKGRHLVSSTQILVGKRRSIRYFWQTSAGS